MTVPNWEEIDKIEGWLFKEEAELLYKYASQITHGIWVEIGAYKGKSTRVLLEAWDPGVVIDPFQFEVENYYPKESFLKEFQDNLGEERLKLLWVMKELSTSPRAINSIPPVDTLSLLYIDGDHSYEAVKFDFENYSPKVVPDGYVIFHDAWGENGEQECTPLPEVTRFVKELIAEGKWINVENVRRCAVFQRAQ